MTIRAILLLLLLATADAASAGPLGQERAQQLLTRAGFAPSAAELSVFAPLTQAQAVDRLLAGARTTAATPPPEWIDEPVIGPREFRALSEERQKAERQRNLRQSLDLRRWWLAEMVATPSPLTERMTLFWHNHFVSAQPKVRWAQLMYRQNVLLRQHAVGNFRVLLHAIARDPAMVVYLDSATSRRGKPNENFAREVMELFTLGQGHYTEIDIKESARAFTGFSLDPEHIGLRLSPGFPRRREQDRARRHGSAHRRRRARHPAGAARGGGFHRRQTVARVRFTDAGSGPHRPDCPPIPR